MNKKVEIAQELLNAAKLILNDPFIPLNIVEYEQADEQCDKGCSCKERD